MSGVKTRAKQISIGLSHRKSPGIEKPLIPPQTGQIRKIPITNDHGTPAKPTSGPVDHQNPIFPSRYDEIQILNLGIHVCEKLLQDKPAAQNSDFSLNLRESIGIAISSNDHRLSEVNKHLSKMLGYTRKELLELNWKRLICPDDLENYFFLYHQMLSGTLNGFSLDIRCLSKTGKTVYTCHTLHCVRSPEGTRNNIVSLVREIAAGGSTQQNGSIAHSVKRLTPNSLRLMQEAALSKREMEIARMLVIDGLSDKEIADGLFLSIHTIRTHFKNIYRKFNISNRSKLTALLR